MSISKVADRLFHLQLAADERPTSRRDLVQQYDHQAAVDDLRNEMSRYAEVPPDPVPNAIPSDSDLSDAHCRLREALCRVGGKTFGDQCWLSLAFVSGAYKASIEFRGWPADMSCLPDQEDVFVLWPREPFKFEASGGTLPETVELLESSIKTLKYNDPTKHKAALRNEFFALTSGQIVSQTQYITADVPGIGRMVARFFRRTDGKEGNGPWERVPYPNTKSGVLIVPIPH